MEIKKVASDNRGDVHAFEFGGKTHTLVSFGPNVYRGGHYHKNGQWHTCLSGMLNLATKDMDTKKETHLLLREGDSVFIRGNVAHLLQSIDGEAVLAESRMGEYEATDYEPYRILARPK